MPFQTRAAKQDTWCLKLMWCGATQSPTGSYTRVFPEYISASFAEYCGEPDASMRSTFLAQKRRRSLSPDIGLNRRLTVNNIPQVNKSLQAFLPAESGCACTENAGFSRMLLFLSILCCVMLPMHMSEYSAFSLSPTCGTSIYFSQSTFTNAADPRTC